MLHGRCIALAFQGSIHDLLRMTQPAPSEASRFTARPGRLPLPLGFEQALWSGGDARMAVDPVTGLNPYFCPSRPSSTVSCLSSCTASPPSLRGYERARSAFVDISMAPTPTLAAIRTGVYVATVQDAILRHFGAVGAAEVVLCASGTDAVALAVSRTAALLPDGGVRHAVAVPVPGETGSGVPEAATTRACGTAGPVVRLALRDDDGVCIPPGRLDAAFAAAADGGIVVITHGTKTGLVVPSRVPRGALVVVDACQARIRPADVASHLALGRPVAVTGSKFLGGPAFSGAVLFPAKAASKSSPLQPGQVGLGPLLRWIAALDNIEALAAVADPGRLLFNRRLDLRAAMGNTPGVLPVAEVAPGGSGWPGGATILSFMIVPSGTSTPLGVDALRVIHRKLAMEGVLFGQPVPFGQHGVLRAALGARDACDDDGGVSVRRAFTALRSFTSRLVATA